jgi:hypothetical protein
VIKATLDFTLASMGSKDRLSLVTFEVGQSGRVRRTPFLSVTKAQSRQRLEKFIDEIGVRVDEAADEFLVRGSKDEKTDVVTAVNHGVFSLGKIFLLCTDAFQAWTSCCSASQRTRSRG